MDGGGATHWFGNFKETLQNVLWWTGAIGEEEIIVWEAGFCESWGYFFKFNI